MPRATSRRNSSGNHRCAFREDGERCRRIGFGNPPLCRAHAILLELELERRDPMREILSDLDRRLQKILGRDESPTVGVVADFFSRWLAQIAARRSAGAPMPRVHSVRERTADGGYRDIPITEPWFRQPPPPPVVDLKADAARRARKVLGFKQDQILTRDLVKARQRKLAMRHHPDRGGSAEAMAKVNRAADDLLATLP